MQRARDAGFRLLVSPRATMCALGAFSVLLGFFYLPDVVHTVDRLPAVERLLPIAWWSAAWMVVGVLVILSAVTRRAMSAAVGLQGGAMTVWTTTYLIAWATGNSDRGFVTATVFGVLTYLTMSFFARADLGVPRE